MDLFAVDADLAEELLPPLFFFLGHQQQVIFARGAFGSSPAATSIVLGDTILTGQLQLIFSLLIADVAQA